jgi:hypothetical protein
MNLKTGLLAGACVILAVVAVIGWTHGRTTADVNQPATYAQPNYVPPTPAQSANYNPAYSNGAPAYSNGVPAYPPNPVVYDNGLAYQGGLYYPDSQYVQSIHRPVVVRRAEEPPPPPEYSAGYTETRPREYRDRREYREYRHGRSTGKSVAIVAGSAGVGAAVGALAGGGKGAGIGALAGGAGRFIYDRLTHNR